MAPCDLCSPRVLFSRLAVAVLLLFAVSCGSSTSTSVTAPSGTRCGVTVSTGTSAVPAGGGTGALTINTERECAWSARAEASWVTLSATEGQGPTTLSYTVAPNAVGKQRRGAVQVVEQRVEIVQDGAPCTFELNRSDVGIDATGGSFDLGLTATSGCAWTATSGSTWIGNAIPSSGEGSATIRFSVAANAGALRSATVNVAGIAVRVEQAATAPTPTPTPPPPPAPAPPPPPGPAPTPPAPVPPPPAPNPPPPAPTPPVPPPPAPTPPPPAPTPPPTPTPTCTYALTPASKTVARGGEEVVVSVTSSAGCAWTATSNAAWIVIAAGATGTGSGTVRLDVRPNPDAPRTGTVRIADQTFTVTQEALQCSYSIDPTSRRIDSSNRAVTVKVKAESGCAWTAASDVAWITVTRGSSGSGVGDVELNVAANDTSALRTGTVRIAGRVFTLEQEASNCSYSLKPTWYDAGRGPDDVEITVNAQAGCAWTATKPETATWVTIAEGSSGRGKGTVRLVIEANFGPARSVELLIAGEVFTLRQAAR